MSLTTDGNFTTAGQNGAAQLSLPLEASLDYYAYRTRRQLSSLANSYKANLAIGNRTSYTNLLTYSEDFSNAAWAKLNVTAGAAGYANPADGLVTMYSLLETVTNGVHDVVQATYSAVNGNAYTFSAFIRAAGRGFVSVNIDDGTTTFAQSVINLTTGAVFSNASGSVAVSSMGNGVYRVSVSGTASHTATGNVALLISTDGSTFSYAGDITKGIYAWGAMVNAGSSAGPYIPTTSVARTISSPNVDSVDALTLTPNTPGDPFAYLCEEGEPEGGLLLANYALWSRNYQRIPAQNLTYSTMAINKPTPVNSWPVGNGALNIYTQDALFGTFTLIGLGSYNEGYIYCPTSAVFGPMKGATATAPGVATGGTFTVTYKASTTGALNYNDNNATIAAAINGLASVIADGITVTWTGNGWNSATNHAITLTAGTTSTPFSVNAASLTGVVIAKAFVYLNSTALQTAVLAVKVQIGSHGFAGTEKLVFGNNSSGDSAGVLNNTSWSVFDANTLATANLVAGPSAVSAANLFGVYLRDYTPGPDRVIVKILQNFYLPGVTVGITTPTDIPVPDPLLNDTAFLAAVVANLSGYVTYDAQPLDLWFGPIYQQKLLQINMANV